MMTSPSTPWFMASEAWPISRVTLCSLMSVVKVMTSIRSPGAGAGRGLIRLGGGILADLTGRRRAVSALEAAAAIGIRHRTLPLVCP